ncbi:MAG: cobalamin biosynthesis protein CobD [Clostridiales bacterium GWB2_37_7]|nr:MAG: cobalamin biosynthesis protein CobD [Clostridiales bacterium GWB2_37_7]
MISIFAAVLIDAFVGDPYWFPHPVRLLGRYIKAFEKLIRPIANTPASLRIAGILLTLTTVLLAFGSTYLILQLVKGISLIFYYILNVLFMYTCLAARCLSSEAMKIYKELLKGDIAAARKQTSMIVGRDTDVLGEKEVTRAVVETVAENSSDGVIAPLIYMAIGGAPLAMAYKAINTLDSMVGYKNDKYLHFGWCSARLDDLVNFIPARLTAVLMAVAALFMNFDALGSFNTFLKDGKNHSSPNSGFPEAAAAGALGIELGGTNLYFGRAVYKPTIGQNKRPIEKQDIKSTILLMFGAYALTLIIIGIINFISG